LLIGRQGATLHALQILVQALANRRLKSQEPLWFTLDVDDYKRKREWYLKETAKGAAEQIKKPAGRCRWSRCPIMNAVCPRLFAGALSGHGKFFHCQDPYGKS